MQPLQRVIETAGARGARDQRIDAEHQARAEDHDCGEDAAPHAGCGNRCRAEAADHHGIDEPHRHPADFGKDDRTGEKDERAEFGKHGQAGLKTRPYTTVI